MPTTRTLAAEQAIPYVPAETAWLDADKPCAERWWIYDITIDRKNAQTYARAVEEARDICRDCPVKAECLRLNLDAEGVIAGMTLEERQKLKRKAAG